jgi:hypothetical protein
MSDAFVGLLLTLRKYKVQNAKSNVTYCSKGENRVTRFKPAKIGLRVLTGAQADRFQNLKAFFLPHSKDPFAQNT